MKRARKRTKRTRTAAPKMLVRPPEPSPLPERPQEAKSLAFLLAAIQTLNELHPWLLAAAMDWIRTQWRGETSVLDRPLALAEAVEWIETRAKETRTRAMDVAVAGVLRAAVTA